LPAVFLKKLMIKVNGLYKSFGNVHAICGISFQAPDGQITGLLGPNGAGKTTTLRILYTILKPDEGEAEIDGFNLVDEPLEVQQRIGALPDTYGLYPRLTGRENIRYYGRLHGLEGEKLEAKIDNMVKLLEIQEIIDRRTEGFSHGERLKISIARALIHDPHNLLLDEPTNGLDVISTRGMRSLIRRFRDEGRCVLFSSHIMQEVSALCENIVIVSNGIVMASGTSEDLREKTGRSNLEDAFVDIIGSEEGLIRG
jgi:sodium transport system ATP-binding protein